MLNAHFDSRRLHVASLVCFDRKAGATTVRLLGDHIDTIAQELTELLGAPSALAEPDAAAPDDREAHDGAPMLTSITGSAS